MEEKNVFIYKYVLYVHTHTDMQVCVNAVLAVYEEPCMRRAVYGGSPAL